MHVGERPWGPLLAELADRHYTGRVSIDSDGKRYAIVFERGVVVDAASPLPADSAVRAALTGHLISSSVVSVIGRRVATSPGKDDVEVVVEAARLTPEQAGRLRSRVVLQRAARTFAIDAGVVTMADDAIVTRRASIDVRTVVMHGARMHFTEQRLATELKELGTHFALKLNASLAGFEIGTTERPIIEALRGGTTLADIEAHNRDIDPRTAQAVIYALVACGACGAHGGQVSEARAKTVSSEMLDSRTRTVSSEMLDSRTRTVSSEMLGARQPLVDVRTKTVSDSERLLDPRTKTVSAEHLLDPRTKTVSVSNALEARTKTEPLGDAVDARTRTVSVEDLIDSRTKTTAMPPRAFARPATPAPSESDPGVGTHRPRTPVMPIPSRTMTPTVDPLSAAPSTSPPPAVSRTISGAGPAIPRTVSTGAGPAVSRTVTPQPNETALGFDRGVLPATGRTATGTMPSGSPPLAAASSPAIPVSRTSTPTSPLVSRTTSVTGVSYRAGSQPGQAGYRAASAPGDAPRDSQPFVARTPTPVERLARDSQPVISRTQTPTRSPGDSQSRLAMRPPTSPAVSRTFTPKATAADVTALVTARLGLIDQGADYFIILGLSNEAPIEAIRVAHLRLAALLQPANLALIQYDDADGRAARLREHVENAFHVLSDPARRTAYTAALRRNPTDLALRAARAHTYEEVGDRTPAEEAFQRGQLAMRNDMFAKALVDLQQACELEPTNLDYAVVLAFAKFCAAFDKDAILGETKKVLERGVQRADKPEVARFYLGRIERMLGRDAAALHHFRQVLELCPEHKEAASEVRVLEARERATKSR